MLLALEQVLDHLLERLPLQVTVLVDGDDSRLPSFGEAVCVGGRAGRLSMAHWLPEEAGPLGIGRKYGWRKKSSAETAADTSAPVYVTREMCPMLPPLLDLDPPTHTNVRRHLCVRQLIAMAQPLEAYRLHRFSQS